MQALTSLADVSSRLSLAVKGMSDANKMFAVHSIMASLQGTAINNSSSTQGLTLAPSGIDPACVSGTAATGFTYNHCSTENGGYLDGAVKITPTSVEYDDLKIVSGNTSLILDGAITFTTGRLTGDLEYQIHTDLGSAGVFGGAIPNTDVTTNTSWDISYTEEPSCITAGSIEVKVDYAGMLRGAKFLFSGCASVMVQNG